MEAKKNVCTDGKEAVTARMIASRMAMWYKEKKCANVGTTGNSDIFVCVAHPSALGTTNAESVHGSASPGFCARENEKRGWQRDKFALSTMVVDTDTVSDGGDSVLRDL